jgi:hypothetical protein
MVPPASDGYMTIMIPVAASPAAIAQLKVLRAAGRVSSNPRELPKIAHTVMQGRLTRGR